MKNLKNILNKSVLPDFLIFTLLLIILKMIILIWNYLNLFYLDRKKF